MAIVLNGTTGITTPKLDASDLELGSVNVVERGSNANGEYVRFADGTQICTSAVTFTGNGSWTYPSTFVSTPVVAPVNSSGAATAFSITVVVAAGNSNASLRSLDVTSGSVATRISALTPLVSAIGRWF